MIPSNTATPPKVSGSSAKTPNNRPASTRLDRTAPANPTAIPAEAGSSPFLRTIETTSRGGTRQYGFHREESRAPVSRYQQGHERRGEAASGSPRRRGEARFFWSWPAGNPIGKRVSVDWVDGKPVWRQIAGVVQATHHFGLEAPRKAEIYLPHSQRVRSIMGCTPSTLKKPSLTLRTKNSHEPRNPRAARTSPAVHLLRRSRALLGSAPVWRRGFVRSVSAMPRFPSAGSRCPGRTAAR